MTRRVRQTQTRRDRPAAHRSGHGLTQVSAALCWLLAAPHFAQGHHSYAEYDQARVVEVTGKLVMVGLFNPHVNLKVETLDKGGQRIQWSIESAGINALRRQHVSLADFKVGDTVKIAGWPSRRANDRMFATNLLSQDGRELVTFRNAKPRWSNAATGFVAGAPIYDVGVKSADKSIFRVWSYSPAVNPEREGRGPPINANVLTPGAKRAVEQWDPVGNTTRIACSPVGMPAIMSNRPPWQFIDRDRTIELRLEEYDSLRVLHMNVDHRAAQQQPRSLLGYSTGRWEGRTLVVETSRMSARYFNGQGIPLSPAAHIVERFTPSEDGSELYYESTATDPEVFTRPAETKLTRVYRPDERVMPFNCRTEH